MKYLLIAEKPDLMRQIETVYNRHRDEIPYAIDFVSQRGHLVEPDMPEELDPALKKWAWETLPIHPEEHGGWKYHVIREKKTGSYMTSEERYRQVKKAVNSGEYDGVIHAGDPDQEGELLVRLVLEQAKNTLPVRRFWTNDLTENAVLSALRNLRDDDHDPMLKNLLSAALGRQHSDYRFGLNLSRAASLKMNTVAACGRVETPILAMVCKREEEIRNFRPSTSYGIEAAYRQGFTGTLVDLASVSNDEDASEDAKKGVVRFREKNEAETLAASLPPEATVVSCKKKEVKTYPPKLFKLATAQVAAGKIGYNDADTLAILQRLYEKKLLSYPRTDCEYLSSGEDFRALLKSAESIPELRLYIRRIKDSDIRRTCASKRWINDEALKEEGHSALKPTTQAPDFASLPQDEQDIYRLVVTQFVSIFMDPIIQSQADLITDAGGHTFRTTGKVLIDPGFSVLFGTSFRDNEIPSLTKGDVLNVQEYRITESTTSCPKRFTSPGLIAACENPLKYLDDPALKALGKRLKIGTPATRSATIQKLKTKECGGKFGYLTEKKEKRNVYLVPTEKGEGIIRNLGECAICKVDMTGQWEELLEKVRKGSLSLEGLESQMRQAVDAMVEEIRDMEMENLGTGRPQAEKYAGIWEGRQVSFSRTWNGHRFSDDECKALLRGETVEIQGLTAKSGSTYGVRGRLAEQSYNGRRYVGFKNEGFLGSGTENSDPGRCSGTWMGKQVSFSRKWGGHLFSDEECEKLLRGEEIVIRGLKSKSGTLYDVHGMLAEQEYRGKKYVGFKNEGFADASPSGNKSAETPERDVFSGTWKGKEVTVNRVWGSHRFTDSECAKLLNGEEVIVEGKSKSGNSYKVKGSLKKKTYKGRQYVGFESIGFVD